MDSNYSKKLVWWRDVPVDVELGLLDFLCENWQGDIYIVCSRGYECARYLCNWNRQSVSRIHVIVEEQHDIQKLNMIRALYFEEAVHIFSGIRGGKQRHLKAIKRYAKKGTKCFLLSEPPSLFGNNRVVMMKALAYHALYYYYHLRYEALFSAFFTLGSNTDKIYRRYGWNLSKMLPFMYLPRVKPVCRILKDLSFNTNVRFLYLGRFRDSTKGVLMLKDAFARLFDEGITSWTLDLVGGYGEQSDVIIKWSENTPNVNFLGTWSAEDVCAKASDYDVCLVPSRFEGWNLMPYQAIFAGIGCVVSEGAGSDSLVRNGHFGEVFKANCIDEFVTILNNIINEPSIIENWKANAIRYREKVNQETVGQYFLDCLEFSLGEKEKPKCPWEN